MSRGNYCVWATWTRISLPYIPRDIMGWKEVKRGWSFSWNSLSQKGASVAPLLPSSFFPFPFFSCKDILCVVNLFPSSFSFWKTRVFQGNAIWMRRDFPFSNVCRQRFVISRGENRRRKKMLIGCNTLMYICRRTREGRQFHPCVQSEEELSLSKPRIPEGLIKY